jgi:hypothetical protein
MLPYLHQFSAVVQKIHFSLCHFGQIFIIFGATIIIIKIFLNKMFLNKFYAGTAPSNSAI